jgi:hypothetical protein
LKRFHWILVAGTAGILCVLAVFLFIDLKPTDTSRQGISTTNKKPLKPGYSPSERLADSDRRSPAVSGTGSRTGSTGQRSLTPLAGRDLTEESITRGETLPSGYMPPDWPVGIGPDDVPPWLGSRPEVYIEKIEEIRDQTPSSERTSENNTVLLSGGQPDPINGYPFSDTVFDPTVTRLYAWFPCDNESFSGRNKILAKWTRDDGSEVLFEGMGILDFTPYNFVWWEEPYWSPGEYSVELYGLEEDIPLLAWGTFNILDLEEHFGFAGMYANLEDNMSRQAFYLDEEVYLKVSFSSTAEQQVQFLARRVPEGNIVKGGLITLPGGTDKDFAISLTEPPYPFETGSYVIELHSFPEPQYILGRNVLTVLQ